jgi:large subunit ribosomal protein L25
MSDGFELTAELREDIGKGASRRLRRSGKVPAVLYGGGRKPRSLTLDHTKLLHQMEQEAFYNSVLTINVGKESQAAIVKDVQRHPAKRHVWHIDFQRILADEKIRMQVPFHFMGEDMAPGVKTGGGVFSHVMSDVEITCLPGDLPEYLEIDVSELELDEVIHLSEVKVPDGVELVALVGDAEHDQPVVTIHRPRIEVEEEPEAGEEGEVAEGEADSAGESADGEAPTEGDGD